MDSDAATSIFNLPDYRVISATVLDDGSRRIIIETDQPPGCPTCGVVATRRKERRVQRIRDIPVAGAVEVSGPNTAGTARNDLPAALVLRSHNPGPASCPIHRPAPGPRR
ncbi:transposase family protein [Arthrobacter dokdonensis]|uniref:transposase family protein n=1 Tax=Arthrobacter dokdonellae TaxID=2211210 RepID=UPI001D131B06|nr:transposase family protein [Arthrobacter dokdonellae]